MSEFPLSEQRLSCPFCAATTTIVLDLSAGGQSYIEDCQVCCQPMQVTFAVDGESLVHLEVDRGS